jgi:hypothetical protein
MLAKSMHEMIVKLGSFGRSGGIHEIRAAALVAIGVEGELRDDQSGGMEIFGRKAHFPIGIREYPEVGAFGRQEIGGRGCVGLMNTEQEEQAAVNAADDFAIDGYGSPGDTLKEDSH